MPYGDPFPSIKWMKDGIELTPDGVKIRAEEGADKTQRLILSDVSVCWLYLRNYSEMKSNKKSQSMHVCY